MPEDLAQIYAETLYYSFSSAEDDSGREAVSSLEKIIGMFGKENSLLIEIDEDDDINKKRLSLRKQPPFLVRFQVWFRAGNEVRTRDPQLGKLMLYRLSYSRMTKRRNKYSY